MQIPRYFAKMKTQSGLSHLQISSYYYIFYFHFIKIGQIKVSLHNTIMQITCFSDYPFRLFVPYCYQFFPLYSFHLVGFICQGAESSLNSYSF